MTRKQQQPKEPERITSKDWSELRWAIEKILPDNIEFCDFKKCYPRPCSHKGNASCIHFAFKGCAPQPQHPHPAPQAPGGFIPLSFLTMNKGRLFTPSDVCALIEQHRAEAARQARAQWESELKSPCGTVSPICTEKAKGIIRQAREDVLKVLGRFRYNGAKAFLEEYWRIESLRHHSEQPR